MKITQVLSSQQGSYEWGKRDCLITTEEICFAQGIVVNYFSWHFYSEREAIMIARKEYGSMFQAHMEILGEAGMEFFDEIQTPGNICLLEGRIESSQLGIKMNRKNLTMLGFVTESYEVWSWFKAGLFPLSKYDVKGVMGCPR